MRHPCCEFSFSVLTGFIYIVFAQILSITACVPMKLMNTHCSGSLMFTTRRSKVPFILIMILYKDPCFWYVNLCVTVRIYGVAFSLYAHYTLCCSTFLFFIFKLSPIVQARIKTKPTFCTTGKYFIKFSL